MMMKSYHRHLTMCGRAQERISLFVEELSGNLVLYIIERKSRPASDRPVDQGTRAGVSCENCGRRLSLLVNYDEPSTPRLRALLLCQTLCWTNHMVS